MELPIIQTNRFKLLQLLGGRCRSCPENRPQKLNIDHIHNDGEEERATYGNSEKIWAYYLQNELLAFKRLQPLCNECHREKDEKMTFEDDEVDLNTLQGPPEVIVSKMQVFMDVLKDEELSGEQPQFGKKPVEERKFVQSLINTEKFTEEEARLYIRIMLREASIYESRPGHFNRV